MSGPASRPRGRPGPAPRPAALLRPRQGRRGQEHRVGRARAAGRARQAHARGRGRRGGPPLGALRRPPRRARAGDPAGARPLRDLDRRRAGHRGVPGRASSACARWWSCSPAAAPSTPSPPRRPGCAELVTVGKIWTLATRAPPGTRAPVWDLPRRGLPGHGPRRRPARDGGQRGGDGRERARRATRPPASTRWCRTRRPPASPSWPAPTSSPVTEAIETVAMLRERGLPGGRRVLNGVPRPALRRDREAGAAAVEAAAARAAGPEARRAGAALAHRERQASRGGATASGSPRGRAAGAELPEIVASAGSTWPR